MGILLALLTRIQDPVAALRPLTAETAHALEAHGTLGILLAVLPALERAVAAAHSLSADAVRAGHPRRTGMPDVTLFQPLQLAVAALPAGARLAGASGGADLARRTIVIRLALLSAYDAHSAVAAVARRRRTAAAVARLAGGAADADIALLAEGGLEDAVPAPDRSACEGTLCG